MVKIQKWLQNIQLNQNNCRVGFPAGSEGEESACNAGDLCSIPGLGRSSGKWNGYPH